jgi:tetratricopeptide (TPR) repeat protein
MQSPIAPCYANPNALSPSDRWSLAELYLQLGKLNQSLQLAYSILQQDPSQQQRYLIHQQKVHQLGAEFAEEIADYNRAAYYWHNVTQSQSHNADAWHGLGLAQANLQHYQEAKLALERSLQLNPNNEKVKQNLQQVLQTTDL